MAAVLRFAGHDVTTAAHGREALALLETTLPTVIFSDLDMPELDGWAFRRLQLGSPRLRHIPFVVVSAAAVGDETELQAAATLLKPVGAEDLVSCATLFDRAAHPHPGATP